MPLRVPSIFLLTWILLSALTITAVFSYSVTSANGRASLVASQEKGPYRIDVSILPGQAVVANTHVSVLVLSLANDTPITDATVMLSASGPEGSVDLGPIPAPNNFSPQFYETDVPFDVPGDWNVTVDVASELGEEVIIVPMNVREGGGGINWILLTALGVIIVTVGVWTWDRVSGKKQQSKGQSRST